MHASLNKSIVCEGTPAHVRQLSLSLIGPARVFEAVSSLSMERELSTPSMSAYSFADRKLLYNKFRALADPGFDAPL